MPAVHVDPRRLAEVCDRFGIAALYIFGSAAPEQDGPDSDVDLLYELRPGARLGWEIGDLTDELSNAFGRPVDLVSRRAVHPRLQDVITKDARQICAA